MFQLQDGTRVQPGIPFTDSTGVQRPGNWMENATTDEIKAAGVTVQPDPPEPERYDERFYFSAGNPRDLDQCKTNQIRQIKEMAASLISKYDYKTVREMQGGKVMSTDIKTFCASVRTYSNKVEGEVIALKTVDALVKWVELPFDWPVDPNAPARP